MISILFVGDAKYDVYVRAFYDASKKVTEIGYTELFDCGLTSPDGGYNIWNRLENHYCNGVNVWLLNRKLIDKCRNRHYDIVFYYSSRLIYAGTVKKIQELGSYIAVYCNDNPFSEYFKKYFWKHFLGAVTYADITYAYRESDRKKYISYGAKKVEIMRSYYIRSRNYYIPDDKIDLEVPDVIFLGHLEKDERREYMQALVDEEIVIGVNEDWKDFINKNPGVVTLSKSMSAYNSILNKAQIAIVFLSKINGDTYTRRCFEIPAVKTLMVAPYTEDIASLYKDGKEVILYRNKKEFVEKIKYYLIHKEERLEIAQAGYNRLQASKNEVINRLEQIVKDYTNRGVR